jgi:nucleolar MIF4G domain-containing protein 1
MDPSLVGVGHRLAEKVDLPPPDGLGNGKTSRLEGKTIRTTSTIMPRPMHNTTSLPRDLRSELGIRDTYGEKKRKQNGPTSRKERRQAERTEKKSRRPPAPPARSQNQRPQKEDNKKDSGDAFDLVEDAPKGKSKPASKASGIKQKSAAKLDKMEDTESDDSEPNYLDEDTDEEESDNAQEEFESDSDDDIHDRGHVSSKVQSKLDEDDAEIAALEKKLGLKKGKKLPKSFAEDGLEDLMGNLAEDSEDDSKKRKREADDWLQSKRQKAQERQAAAIQIDEGGDESDSDMEVDLDDEVFGSDDDSEFDGFDPEENAPPKQRENPYIAPPTKKDVTPGQKYIPPSLRARQDPETESLTRLKRQAQGHLNKLSEANLISILAEFEKLYRDYPRQHVTSTIIDLLMGLICERSVLQDTFLVLHAGFIAALYKIMGMDFGAEIVQRVVETLDAEGDEGRGFEGKEGMNLVSLLAQLYNFHVIGSPLIFDYIRLFLAEITESNTELLLKVIRSKYFFLNRHPIFSLLIHPQIVVPSFDKTTRLL